MFCAYCGTQAPDNARFCVICGEKIVIPKNVNSIQNNFDSIPYDPVAQAEFLDDFFGAGDLSDIVSEGADAEEDNEEWDDEEEPIVEEDLSEYSSNVYDSTSGEQSMYSFVASQNIYTEGMNHLDVNQCINNSINYMQNYTNGYYCLGCGNYIDYKYTKYQGYVECPQCGTHIVGCRNTLAQNGWGMRLINNLMNGTIDPNQEIIDYYYSDYFKNTGYLFEQVALDKGLVGEYMIDIEIQKIRKKYPGKYFKVFYNVLIPEPNGSFQEADAIIVYGNYVLFIEAKNRNGRFQYQHISDREWTFINSSGKTQIYSPLMQNEEHIMAFMHYFNKKSTIHNMSRKFFFNQLYLGPLGDFNNTILSDEYDAIVFSANFDIHSGGQFYTCIEELFAGIEAESGRFFDNRDVDRIVDTCKDIFYMNQQEKDLYKRNRAADMKDKGKSEYHYYYAYTTFNQRQGNGTTVEKTEGMLLRTNGVYVQYWDDYYFWQEGEISLVNGKFEFGGTKGLYKNGKVIDLKNLPLEIVKAKRCISNKELYVAGGVLN